MGMYEKLERLSRRRATIRAIFLSSEQMQWQSLSFQDWLSQLNELAYQIDDIIDECATERLRLQLQKTKIRSNPFSLLQSVRHRRIVGKIIKEVMQKLDEVFANQLSTWPTGVAIPQFEHRFSSHIYGRLEEKEKIVNVLVNQVNSCRDVTVLPIVGIGGVGKTTLAELVFNDERIIKHFDPKIWVNIASDNDLVSLLKRTIKYVPNFRNYRDTNDLPIPQRYIDELLMGKRYLLVLDDVWNDNPLDLIYLRKILDCGAPGSSIIVTTRVKKVANMMSTTPAFYLSELSEVDSWSIFKEHAFEAGNGDEYPNLQAIGKEIVKKSYGVPLVVKARGASLRDTRSESNWRRIRDIELWNLSNEEAILPTFLSSYYNLPMKARSCLLFCSVFPKGLEMEKDELIFLWLANGYITTEELSSEVSMEAEEVGHNIWEDLVSRSFFQDVHIFNGKTKFKMHCLHHDLLQFIVDKKFTQKEDIRNERSFSRSRIRHVNWQQKVVAFPRKTLPPIKLSDIVKFVRLRSLDLSHSSIEVLPSAIHKLKQLRLLNLSHTNITFLSESIRKLLNLMILNLECCTEFRGFEYGLSLMPSLRHLLLGGCTSLLAMPSKLHNLTSLRTLTMFLVTQHLLSDQLAELGSLDIGGKLEIRRLERLRNHLDPMKANLAGKQNLRHLVLYWGGNDAVEAEVDLQERVLESLEPHRNIITLEITGFRGRNLPDWMGTLENIESLSFKDVHNLESLPEGLQELDKLKNLNLCNLPLLTNVPDWLVKMKSLSRLLIDSCPRVPTLPATIKEMRELDFLHVKNCPDLEMRCEKGKGDNWSKIRHIPNVLLG